LYKVLKPGQFTFGDPRPVQADPASLRDEGLPTPPVSQPEAPGDPLAEARAEARRLLNEARERRREMLAQAEREAERLRQTAREEGRAQGIEEGRQQGWREVEALVARAMAALEDAYQARQAMLESAKADVVRLAVRVAERLIRAQLEVDPEVALRAAEEALAQVRGEPRIIVRCHPRDALVLEAQKLRLAQVASGCHSVEVVEDEGIDPGGVVVETARGEVDGQLCAQLGVLLERLLEAVSEDATG